MQTELIINHAYAMKTKIPSSTGFREPPGCRSQGGARGWCPERAEKLHKPSPDLPCASLPPGCSSLSFITAFYNKRENLTVFLTSVSHFGK